MNIDILHKCPLFNGATNKEIADTLICFQAVTKNYNKNQTILAEGDPVKSIGIVLSGKVQIVKEDYSGSRSILANIPVSGMFAEAFALAEVSSIPVSVAAAENCSVLFIDCNNIHNVCSKSCSFHNRMIHNMLYIVARKNLVLNQKIECISKRTTKEKLMAYLLFEANKAGSNSFTIPPYKITLFIYFTDKSLYFCHRVKQS